MLALRFIGHFIGRWQRFASIVGGACQEVLEAYPLWGKDVREVPPGPDFLAFTFDPVAGVP